MDEMTARTLRLAFAGLGASPIRSLPRHAHASPIVIWYTRGRGTVVFADAALPFARDTVVCVPAGMPYAERSAHGFISLYLGIDGLALDGVVRFELGDDPRFALAARLVLEESRRHDRAWPDGATEAVSMLVRCLRRNAVVPKGNPLVAAALELIHLHAMDPRFSIASVAARLRATTRRLRTAFQAELRTSPLDYLTARRIGHARRLLESGGFAIGDVAARAGFADPCYFSRVFRASTGLGPAAYRESQRR
jgi:AraC-like DNA-binding protein